MRDEFLLLCLRRVLESAGQGSGLSRSLVESFKGSGGPGGEAARLALLGFPTSASMEPLLSTGSEEVSMLASLVVAAPLSSALLVGKSGSTFALMLERWVKAKESRALEQKVMRFRSLITSGVLGAVTAMISTLGPVVGSLGIVSGAPPGGRAIVYGAAAMAAISSGMLGFFMSGRAFYVNVAVALAAFCTVSVVASPLANVPSVGVLGVI